MENTQNKSTELVKVPEQGLLSLVYSILKDRQLFPEKMEDAKQYLSQFQLA